MNSISDNWLAFITAVFVHLCVKKSIQQCPGCQDEKISPLLHRHHQMSLLDKLACYFEPSRTQMLESMDRLLAEFKKKFADVVTFEDFLIGEGMNFLTKSTPSTIYFGQYLNEFNDVNVESVEQRAAPATSTKRPKMLRLH